MIRVSKILAVFFFFCNIRNSFQHANMFPGFASNKYHNRKELPNLRWWHRGSHLSLGTAPIACRSPPLRGLLPSLPFLFLTLLTYQAQKLSSSRKPTQLNAIISSHAFSLFLDCIPITLFNRLVLECFFVVSHIYKLLLVQFNDKFLGAGESASLSFAASYT